jgi:hypothetical protein
MSVAQEWADPMPDRAAVTTANLLAHVNMGFYDCTAFHQWRARWRDSAASGSLQRTTPHYTACMVRVPCASVVLLAAALANGCGQTMEAAREPSPPARGAAMSETADRQPFEPLLRVAMDDLAQRLNVDAADIGVVEARAVVWPDRSLGCPRPGMVYPQVPQDGVLIRLQVGGREFSYHSGLGRPPFLCEKRR